MEFLNPRICKNDNGSQHRMYVCTRILFLIYLVTFSMAKSSEEQMMAN
jgi:hypothetical protein